MSRISLWLTFQKHSCLFLTTKPIHWLFNAFSSGLKEIQDICRYFGKGKPSTLAPLAFNFRRSQCTSIKKPVHYSNTSQVFLFCLGINSCWWFSIFPCILHFCTGEKFPEAGNLGLDRSQIWPQVPKQFFYEARNRLWNAKDVKKYIIVRIQVRNKTGKNIN